MEHLDKVEKALNGLEAKLCLCKDKKYFIFEHQKNILLKDIRFEVKRYLTGLFGQIKDSNSFGIYNDVFQSEDSVYNKGVMFTYWSFSGVPYNSSKAIDGGWRDNLFYKGTRYSVAPKYKNFYDVFNILSKGCQDADSTQSNAPIDFFVRLNKGSSQLIVFGPITLPESICIPTKASFDDKDYYNIPELKEIIIELFKIKEEKDACDSDEKMKKLHIRIDHLLHNCLEPSFQKLFELDNSLLLEFANMLNCKFKFLDISNKKILRNIYKMIICYQLYDQDGLTLLFVPKDQDSESCLALLVPIENLSIALSKNNEFFSIINTLSKLPILEKKIHNLVQENIVKKDIWKCHYFSRRELYESLCLHFKILMKYICRTNKIKTVDIAFRVKEFDSFFNRAIDRFNEPNKFKIIDDDIDCYRESFLSGDEDSAAMVFSKFWDIAGIRILCVFNDDLHIIKEELYTDTLRSMGPVKNEKYLINVIYTDKKTGNDYRADHYILTIGPEREVHPELTALANLKCEVQVKTTTLSQGWSEADHDLIYKSELSQYQIDEILEKNDAEKIGKGRESCSLLLDRIDDDFDRMRSIIKQMINES
jgi:ppGpp synthetase/RelA/SpoT-type nucleotidyltranferase